MGATDHDDPPTIRLSMIPTFIIVSLDFRCPLRLPEPRVTVSIPSFLVRTNPIREFEELSDRVSFIG